MTAREYLEQAITLDRVIENKIMMVDRLRAIATRTTSAIRKDPGGGGKCLQGLETTIGAS